MAMIFKKPTIAATTMDEISQLPEPILHHILNFLASKEVARTAILSKNWRRIFNSRPVLSFIDIRYEREIKNQKEFLIVRVDDSIQKFLRNKVSIHKFELKVYSYHPDLWDPHMDRWMHQLVNEANVKELCLELVGSTDHTLPPVVFRSKTITSLRLVNCDLTNCNNVKLPNLLELRLEFISSRSQKVIENLILSCPSLEILELIGCRALSEICVSDLVRLKKVVLGCNTCLTKVKIVAPKLQVFESCICSTGTKRFEINLSACELTLKKLRIDNCNITKDVFDGLLSKFHELEELIVIFEPYLDSIEIPNHRMLRRLEIVACKELGEVEIDAPNLQCLRYAKNKVPFYHVNCAQLSEFELSFLICNSCPRDDFSRWTDNFKECFMKFSHFKDMKLHVAYDMDAIICEDCENLLNILYAIKDMDMKRLIWISINVTCVSYECMADYLFKQTRPKNVSFISRHNNANDLLKRLDKKKLKENEEPNCCKNKNYGKCWQHQFYDFERVTKPEEETPNLFKTCVAMGYNITKIKLQWGFQD